MNVALRFSLIVFSVALMMVLTQRFNESNVVMNSVESRVHRGIVEEIEENIQTKEEESQLSSLDEFIYNSIWSLDKYRTFYEKNGIDFKFLKMSYLVNDQVLIKGLKNNREKIYLLEKMQKMALYIKKEYRVDFRLAEEIVYNVFSVGKQERIDPLLILSIIGVESTFKPNSKSSYGAIGLTQVVPRFHREKMTDEEVLWSIRGNIAVGVKVLKEYLGRNGGDVILALQMYNGSLDDESKKYSNKVMANLSEFKEVVHKGIKI